MPEYRNGQTAPLLPDSGPCLRVLATSGLAKGLLMAEDLVGGISGDFGPGTSHISSSFSEAVTDRHRALHLLQAAAGEVYVSVVRSGAALNVVLHKTSHSSRLGLTFAKEDLSLDWCDVREHWLEKALTSRRAAVLAAPPEAAPARVTPIATGGSATQQHHQRPPPPGAPAGGRWVHSQPRGPCSCFRSPRSLYCKGKRVWDEGGVLLTEPAKLKGAMPAVGADGLFKYDPKLISAPSGAKRLDKQWEEEERRLAQPPVSLEDAFLGAGLPKALVASGSSTGGGTAGPG